MTRACLSLLAGMYALQLSSFTASSDYMSAAFVAAIVLLISRQLFVLMWFCVGAALFLCAAQQVINARIPADIAGDSIVVEIKVDGFPSHDASSVSFLAIPVGDERLPSRVRLSWFEPPVEIRSGDSWRLEVRLRRPRGNRNAGAFDYESWLFRERIAAVGYVVNSRRNHLLRPDPAAITERVRRRFVSRVLELVDDAEQAAVLVALVVGTRHLITSAQWDRYARTGSSHLMAISGLHIGLAAGGAYMIAMIVAGLLGAQVNNRNHLWIAILFSLLVALLYAQVSGFAVPARRASLMLALGGATLLRKRQPDLPAIISAACIAIAISDPLSTMAPGFVLSFAAVAVLIWIAQRRKARLTTLQLMLLFGLLPLTVIFFDRIVFAALPVNLVAVPLFSFVTVPLSLSGLLLDGPLQPLGDQAILLAARSIALLEIGLTLVASMHWAAITVPTLVATAWLTIFLPTAWLLLPPGWPGRYLAWLGIVAILLYVPRKPEPGCVMVDVLDVGQGLAVVVRTHAHVLLYDTGPSFRGGGSAADSVILPYLSSYGIRAIDRMVVSHADLDHAGGVASITAAIPVHRILSGEPLPDARSVPCRAGQSWFWDGIEFEVLHPPLDSRADGNNRSCVVLLRAGEHRVLLSGDIERDAERRLVREQGLPRALAVIVPHHGSRTSSTAAFVQSLRPSVAIVSAAFGNHWGFPKEDVVARWQAVGAEVLSTATSGAIGLQLCATSGLESIAQYRIDNRRIWHE